MQDFEFPMPPYEVQKEISKLLYDSLDEERKLCIIESPTGTGKSYSVLVGLTTWIKKNKYKPKNNQAQPNLNIPSFIVSLPEDYYQIQEEKKRIANKLEEISHNSIAKLKTQPKRSLVKQESAFDPEPDYLNYNLTKHQNDTLSRLNRCNLPKIVYTSRTHSQLSQIIDSFNKLKTDLKSVAIASKKQLCINKSVRQTLNPDHECSRRLDTVGCSFYSRQGFMEFFNTDIEDSLEKGNKHSKCPYYQLKSILDLADVICVPYASIMSKSVRQKIGIQLQNSIVVFDQGHNVIENQLQMRSIELGLKDLMNLKENLNNYQNKFTKLNSTNTQYIHQMQKIISGIENLYIKTHQAFKNGKEIVDVLEPGDFISKLGIHQFLVSQIRNYVQQSHLNHKIYNDKNISNPHCIFNLLNFFQEILIYSGDQNRVLLKMDLAFEKCSVKLISFNVQKIHEIIEQARMTVIVGGTLSPISTLEPLLKKYNGQFRSFDHIIDPKNCTLYIMDQINNKPITFTYQTKNQIFVLSSINQLLKQSLKKTNQGIVVFVQSYKYLQIIKGFILKESYYSSMCVFDQSGKLNTFNVYQQRIKNKQQSILFSVMGGKLSEGINFSDQLVRILIVLGVPYPDTRSSEMKLKIKNNQPNYIQNISMKAVNQTIGRAIRHAKDYASIVLVDKRFINLQNKLPNWMKKNMKFITSPNQIKPVKGG